MHNRLVNVELAERAEQIMKKERIEFGEALCKARVQMADASPDASSYIGKAASAAQVSAAVVEGLQQVAPTWKKDAEWIATSGAQAVRAGCAQVESRLKALGIGDQFAAAMYADLQMFLNNAMLKNPYTGALSDLIASAANHTANAYEQALANDLASTLSEDQIRYAVRLGNETYSSICVDSIVLSDKAKAIASDRGLSFGEALNVARASLAEDVVGPDMMKQTVHTALRDKLNSLTQGKNKVAGQFDLQQAHEAAMNAVKKLNTSGFQQVSDAVAGSINGLISADKQQVLIAPGDVESIASRAADAASSAYSEHLKSVS